jgi:hypothetical protein
VFQNVVILSEGHTKSVRPAFGLTHPRPESKDLVFEILLLLAHTSQNASNDKALKAFQALAAPFM